MAITVTVTKGDGQLAPSNLGISSKDIIIQVLNAGAAVVGATLTITCMQGGSPVGSPPVGYPFGTITDANGNITIRFVSGTMVQSQGYTLEFDFTVTYSGVSTTFVSTSYYVSPQNIPGVYLFRLLPTPAQLNPYTATAGSPGTPIKVQVIRADTGAGVPKIGVKLIPYNDGTGGLQQTITSAEQTGPEGLVFTAADGTATLTPTFAYGNASLSNVYQSFQINIGTFFYFGPFEFKISGGTGAVGPVNIVSAASVGKTLFIGTSAVPANWYTAAYDDSAWTAPVLQTLATVGSPIAGTSWVTNVNTGQLQFTYCLYRYSFPVGASGAITLSVAVDNTLIEVWFNGTNIYTGAAGGTTYPAIAVTVSSALILPNAQNILAFKIYNDAGATAGNPLSLDFYFSMAGAAVVAPAPPSGSIVPSTDPAMTARGNIDFDQVAVANRHGNGPAFQMSDRQGRDGNLAMFRNGVLTDSGIPVTGVAAVAVSPAAVASTTHSEMLTETSGVIITINGDTIYVLGVPN